MYFSEHIVDKAPPFQDLTNAPPLYPFSHYRLGAAEAVYIRPWEEVFSDPRYGRRSHRHDSLYAAASKYSADTKVLRFGGAIPALAELASLSGDIGFASCSFARGIA
jgi:hypothetical protein